MDPERSSLNDLPTVEAAAHYPNLERPAAYHRILLDFLHRQDC